MTILEQRFWAKVNRNGAAVRPDLGQCWEWTGAQLSGVGYGRMRIAGKEMLAHRLSWEMHHEQPPSDLCICHRCDNRLCVRPDHLFLGTRAENNLDAQNKGRTRGPTSENSHRAKLTRVEVDEIRRTYQRGGFSQERMGKMFGVTRTAISNVVRGRTWQ